MGGGVMKQQQLFPLIRSKLLEKINGYIQNDYINDPHYVCPPALGENAGAAGALALAEHALNQQERIPS